MRVRSVLVLLMAAAVAACAGDGGGNDASRAATATSGAPRSWVALASPKLPAIQPVAKAGGVAVKATNEADWMLVAHGRAWVGPRQGRRGSTTPEPVTRSGR
jgi:hypothetical protein